MTVIADTVVSKIAGIAAREVAGVHDLGGASVGASMTGMARRFVGADLRGQGVSVEVGQREAAVDLNVKMDYGVNIGKVADGVRANVVNRVQSMTGLLVKEVNVNVVDLYFPEDDQEPAVPRRRVE
jgi:uncharacterized alkaline shock family protein YloU